MMYREANEALGILMEVNLDQERAYISKTVLKLMSGEKISDEDMRMLNDYLTAVNEVGTKGAASGKKRGILNRAMGVLRALAKEAAEGTAAGWNASKARREAKKK